MERGSLEDVGVINQRAGVREEKWSMLDLKPLQLPKTTAFSVTRATQIQHSEPEADFIRAMGIVSPSAALYVKAVIAGVQRDLPVYRRRDEETTKTDWAGRTTEEEWHSRAEAAVQSVGITQECWVIARMLRHDPPVRLILMVAYHRLLPARSREEEEASSVCQGPAVGDQGAVSTFQKLQAWKSAARRLRQMGGTLPGVTTLMAAFDKILAAFK